MKNDKKKIDHFNFSFILVYVYQNASPVIVLRSNFLGPATRLAGGPRVYQDRYYPERSFHHALH